MTQSRGESSTSTPVQAPKALAGSRDVGRSSDAGDPHPPGWPGLGGLAWRMAGCGRGRSSRNRKLRASTDCLPCSWEPGFPWRGPWGTPFSRWKAQLVPPACAAGSHPWSCPHSTLCGFHFVMGVAGPAQLHGSPGPGHSSRGRSQSRDRMLSHSPAGIPSPPGHASSFTRGLDVPSGDATVRLPGAEALLGTLPLGLSQTPHDPFSHR